MKIKGSGIVIVVQVDVSALTTPACLQFRCEESRFTTQQGFRDNILLALFTDMDRDILSLSQSATCQSNLFKLAYMKHIEKGGISSLHAA